MHWHCAGGECFPFGYHFPLSVGASLLLGLLRILRLAPPGFSVAPRFLLLFRASMRLGRFIISFMAISSPPNSVLYGPYKRPVNNRICRIRALLVVQRLAIGIRAPRLSDYFCPSSLICQKERFDPRPQP